MKKIFTLLILGMVLFSTSCEKEPFLEYELPNLGKSLEIEAEGGSIDIDITADCNYEILCKDSWVSVEETESGIRVKVDANIKTKSRETEIRLLYNYKKEQLYKSIKVAQKAFEPTLSVDKTELNFDVNGGTKTVIITTNASAFSVSEASSWISYTKIGNSVKITASASDVTTERTAEVKIYLSDYNLSQTIKVTQKEFVPVLDVNATELILDVIGSSQTIYVTANIEYDVSENVDWLSYTKTSSGITLRATANINGKERAADVNIYNNTYGKSATIRVIQSEQSANCIIYTSVGGNIINPYKPSAFGANIILNTYKDGAGFLLFDGPVTSIGEEAFCYYDNLKSLKIPNSVTTIGNKAFYGCSSLRTIRIPDSVVSIGEAAFANCSSLYCFYGKYASEDRHCLVINGVLNSFVGDHSQDYTAYTTPDCVTSIGNYAFYGSKFTTVTIGDSVTSIGNNAFGDCTNLSQVTIPDSVISIGYDAFANCSSLRSVHIEDLSAWCKIEFGNIYANPILYAKQMDLNGSYITELIIPSDVTEIKANAFYRFSSLKSLKIPDSVTSIGGYAFRECSGLKSVTIGNGVTSIGNKAFEYCSSLTSVTIGNGVTSVGSEAFDNCEKLTSVYISDLSAWCKIDFGNYSANPLWYADELILNGSKLTEIAIPSDVTEIKAHAFYQCESFTKVMIPDSVTSIGAYAFGGYFSLTSITIGKGVTSIGREAFGACDRIYCKPTVPPSLSDALAFSLSGSRFYVPTASVEAYKAAEFWSKYKYNIVGYDFE